MTSEESENFLENEREQNFLLSLAFLKVDQQTYTDNSH